MPRQDRAADFFNTIGENETFGGDEDFLRAHGVAVEVRNDSRCKPLMDEFILRYPQVWSEDIGQD